MISVFVSEWAFPFEGNGNSPLMKKPYLYNNNFSLNEPSRLKGMELSFFKIFFFYINLSEWAFPFEGNGNRVSSSISENRSGLNEPSRLKGMETHTRWCLGNDCWVWMSLPVWREWKPRKNAVGRHCSISNRVWMSLPVWREWKLILVFLNFITFSIKSEWAFPFEGNGNLY